MHAVGDGEGDVAVDAGAGVPAAGRQPVLDLDDDGVLPTELGVAGQVEGERRVAVRMGAELDAVEPDGGVHVHAVEVDGDALAGEVPVDGEGLAVPAGAAGEVCAFGLVALRVLLRDAVVMRQVDLLPGRIVERRILRLHGIGQHELPVGVEIRGAILLGIHGAGVDHLRRGAHLRGGVGSGGVLDRPR